jgi:preprotein translocase subunit SecG
VAVHGPVVQVDCGCIAKGGLGGLLSTSPRQANFFLKKGRGNYIKKIITILLAQYLLFIFAVYPTPACIK